MGQRLMPARQDMPMKAIWQTAGEVGFDVDKSNFFSPKTIPNGYTKYTKMFKN